MSVFELHMQQIQIHTHAHIQIHTHANGSVLDSTLDDI